jgi:hypothetical protein
MKYEVSVKKSNGSRMSYVKEFNDENHLNNWIDWSENKGDKVIGIKKL